MAYDLLKASVFEVDEAHFEALALQVFRYQSQHCEVYRRFLGYLQVDASKIEVLEDIPFLPIEFFKQFEVKTNSFNAEAIFESSSTTGTGVSRHHVKSLAVYQEAFKRSFAYAFQDHSSYCHLALLPSYLERQNSSLVYQVNQMIQESVFPESAFFLHDTLALKQQLEFNASKAVPTVLWGVSFALLDFVEQHKIDLKNCILIETGGMKGRRKEITRNELHAILKAGFHIETISGEYGMTELMSQAYAQHEGLYAAPPWMRISVREINDPLGKPIYNRHGAINIIDLANLHSCAFIASSDLGKVHSDGRFEVLGRIDHSDTRGCNLMV